MKTEPVQKTKSISLFLSFAAYIRMSYADITQLVDAPSLFKLHP